MQVETDPQSLSALESALRAIVPPVDLDRFRLWHVESLLNQSSDLLDRIIRDRNEHFELRARWDQLKIQEEQDKNALAALEQQSDAGMWNTEVDKVKADAAAREGMKRLFADAVSQMTEYAKQIYDQPNEPPPTWWQARAGVIQANIAANFNTLDAQLKLWQQKWEESQRAQRQLALANLKTVTAKKSALLTAGQSLYLPYRTNALEKRLTRDYQHLLERLLVADKGLEVVYDYFNVTHEPRIIDIVTSTSSENSVLDVVAIWVRSAIRWLTGFGQLDQAWTLNISLRDRVGDNAFKRAVKSDGAALLDFALPSSLFRQHAYVRLRGMAMFVIGDDVGGSIRARVDVPRRAIYNRLTGENGLSPYQVDQTSLPFCHFGRIERRRVPRAPEVVGVVTLMNASPISDETYPSDGLWRVAIDQFGKGELAHCEDFSLELNLLGRPIRVRL